MEIDVKKVVKTPKDWVDAVEFMNESQQNVISALHIMISFIENPNDLDIHNKQMNEFIKAMTPIEV